MYCRLHVYMYIRTYYLYIFIHINVRIIKSLKNFQNPGQIFFLRIISSLKQTFNEIYMKTEICV